MKSCYCFLLLLLTTFTVLADCRNDSTVLCFEFLNDNYYVVKSNSVSYFHLDSGTVDICVSQSINWSPFGPFNCNSDYYTRESRSVNQQGLTTELLSKTGTPAGWINSGDIRYSYDSLGNLLNEIHFIWNGTGWDTTYEKVRNYNPANLLLEEFTKQGGGGVLNNIRRISINYSGNNPSDKIFQHGNGNAWVNDSQFVFIYNTGNLRDSLIINYWDTISIGWLFSYKSHYKNNLIATITRTDTVTVYAGFFTEDTTRYELDTLDNLLLSTSFIPYGFSTGLGINGERTLYNYNYFNGLLRPTRSYQAHVYTDTSTSIESSDCVYLSLHFFYDSLGRLVDRINDARCGNPRGGRDSSAFDPDGFMTYRDSAYGTMVYSYSWNRNYYHADSSFILAAIPPWQHYQNLCQGDQIQINVQPIGGCAPYHYRWTPDTCLSSDTIPDPVITAYNHPINYTILVYDNYGHSDTVTYYVQPRFSPIIYADRSDYHYLGILSTFQNPHYTYNWYLNDALIPGAIYFNYYATLPGVYTVHVYNPSVYCTAISDTVILTAPGLYISHHPASHALCIGGTIALTISCLSSQPVSCQWFKNNIAIPGDTSFSLLIPSAGISDAGRYFAIVRNGIDTLISDTANITVSLFPQINAVASLDSICPGTPVTISVNGAQQYSWSPVVSSDSVLTIFPLSTIDLLVVGTNQPTCTDSAQVSIFVFPGPDTSVSLSGAVLTSNAVNATYQWLDCQNNYSPVSGATNQSYTLLADGNYAVAVANSFCTDTSACVLVNLSGISDINNNQSLIIFPTPVRNILYVDYRNTGANMVYKIFDSYGQVQVSGILDPGMNEIQMNDLADGIYFLFCPAARMPVVKIGE